MNELHERIRAIVSEHGRISDPSQLENDSDLYALGMTSHASVAVMLALEATFDVEFPDHMLTRQVFESVQNIARAVVELQGGTAAAGGQ